LQKKFVTCLIIAGKYASGKKTRDRGRKAHSTKTEKGMRVDETWHICLEDKSKRRHISAREGGGVRRSVHATKKYEKRGGRGKRREEVFPGLGFRSYSQKTGRR